MFCRRMLALTQRGYSFLDPFASKHPLSAFVVRSDITITGMKFLIYTKPKPKSSEMDIDISTVFCEFLFW